MYAVALDNLARVVHPPPAPHSTRVEADIEPFKGILLGLFFVTTGSSFDVPLFLETWPIVLAMVGGLLAVKTLIIGVLAPLFGLSKAESIRTAFTLSQGGEFAFVLLALANQLNVLPVELNKLLIMVVVMSMALTPLLAEVGKSVAEWSTASGTPKPQGTHVHHSCMVVWYARCVLLVYLHGSHLLG